MRAAQNLMRATPLLEGSGKGVLKRLSFPNRGLTKAVLGIGLFFGICTIITSNTHLGECGSDSLKGFKYALFIKTSSFHRGDIVLIQSHPVKYKGEIAFAKRILGMPGDSLTRDRQGICVVSLTQKTKPLPLLGSTREGLPLTPLKAAIIPEGYVFVEGDHPRSFDSRYEEFGLVAQDRLWGKARSVW